MILIKINTNINGLNTIISSHWYKKNELKKFINNEIYLSKFDKESIFNKNLINENKLKIELTFFEKSNKRDLDNLIFLSKYITDYFQKNGYIKNDNLVFEISAKKIIDKEIKESFLIYSIYRLN